MMITNKNHRIAAAIGTGGADTLQAMLNAGRSVNEIAAAMGCAPQMLTNLLAEPAPPPGRPWNWTPTSINCPAGWARAGMWEVGAAPIAYAGPEGGFTWGPPVFVGGSADGNSMLLARG